MKKSQLPSKICLVCLRPFNWRKKWQKDWQNVKYCSKRCAGERKAILPNPSEGSDVEHANLRPDKLSSINTSIDQIMAIQTVNRSKR
ncbi:DUF2256 domain-containing protein [Shewanella glacialimarina]|jgi:hypothetical protein|nr:DUF2256 domain-containing protein [Shewanella glacialimarina]